MPDIGGLEFLVIAVVALIVLGPKDLTKLFRSLGQFTGKVRGMAKEFSRAMNDAADDAGVGDLKRDLRDLSNPKKMGLDAVNKAFEGIDPTKYPEGSESRTIAEKKVAASEATAQRIAEIQRKRAEKDAAAETTGTDPVPAADPMPATSPEPEQTPRPSAGDT